MKTTKIKIDFKWNGLEFKGITVHKAENGWGFAPMMGVSQVVRQYMKQRFPKVPFQISTDSYSMGDSVRIYISPRNVDKDTVNRVREELQIIFEMGHFNGMIDMYEYKSDCGVRTTVGETTYEFRTKYLFVEYRPKYGTKEFDEYEKHQSESIN